MSETASWKPKQRLRGVCCSIGHGVTFPNNARAATSQLLLPLLLVGVLLPMKPSKRIYQHMQTCYGLKPSNGPTDVVVAVVCMP